MHGSLHTAVRGSLFAGFSSLPWTHRFLNRLLCSRSAIRRDRWTSSWLCCAPMGSIVSPTCVADVRTMPRSRRHPQFNIENLPQSLRSAGIGYVHLPGLGGRRRPRPDSPNTGWRNPSFQGYADHMQTIEFAKDLARLM